MLARKLNLDIFSVSLVIFILAVILFSLGVDPSRKVFSHLVEMIQQHAGIAA